METVKIVCEFSFDASRWDSSIVEELLSNATHDHEKTWEGMDIHFISMTVEDR
jgi:hypothetical protein